MQTVTSTEFARNPRGVFDRVAANGETLSVTRHGQPVAQVSPVKKTLSGPELLARLRSIPRLKDPTWLEDCKSGNMLEEFVDPWER